MNKEKNSFDEAVALLMPVVAFPAKAVAPACADFCAAADAPLNRLEAAEFPVAIARWMMTGAAIVLKIIQMPRNANPMRFCSE